MPRRRYTEDQLQHTADLVREELTPIIERDRFVTLEQFNQARSRVASRNYYRTGFTNIVMSKNEEDVLTITDMICNQ